MKYYAELSELSQFFFEDLPINNELILTNKQLKKLEAVELERMLKVAGDKLTMIEDWQTDRIQTALNELLDETGEKPGVLFSLIRIASTQSPASPGLAETLATLGKDRSLARLQTQLDAFAS